MTASGEARNRAVRADAKAGEAVLSWAAIAAAAGAVFAWAACCVLPMSLALAGVGLGGLSWIAGQRTLVTVAAVALIGAGWLLTWRRARRCRAGTGCLAPSRLGITLLAIASALAFLALAWQPIIEPWALTLIRGARG